MANFIIGVGAQFAGQALLKKVLENTEGVFFHPLGSLHVFDVLSGVLSEESQKKMATRALKNAVDTVVDAKDCSFMDVRFKCQLRAAKKLSETQIKNINYIDLFRPGVMGAKFLSETTPEYLLVSESEVKKMANALGKETKIIMIVRDPVARFVNAYRLVKNPKVAELNLEQFQKDFNKVKKTDPKWVENQDQINQYETHFERYSKYFDEVLLISYEAMLSQPMQTLKQFEQYLNLEIDPVVFSNQIHQEANASKKDTVKPGVRDLLRKRFESSHQFLDQKFSK